MYRILVNLNSNPRNLMGLKTCCGILYIEVYKDLSKTV